MTLKAIITPSYAGRRNLTWSTSNESIVTVSGGKLTALHEGQATITVKTVNGKKASWLVTVSQATGELLNIGTLMSRPFAAAVAKTFDVESIVKKSTSASGSGKEAPAGQSASAGSDAKDSASSAAAQTLSVPDTASAQKTRIYIYPSEKAGNTPVQDGSIVAGSQLALDTEIVPAQTEKTAFLWKSSDPDVASVDENGIVTAVSAGEAQITASLSGAASADDADSPEGTYKVNVVMPSVLTRNASYSAGDGEEEKIETKLWEAPPEPLLEEIAKRITEECPEWSGSPTELCGFLSVDMKANALTQKLNVNAGRLFQEYGIQYWNKRTHAGRQVGLRLPPRDDA